MDKEQLHAALQNIKLEADAARAEKQSRDPLYPSADVPRLGAYADDEPQLHATPYEELEQLTPESSGD